MEGSLLPAVAAISTAEAVAFNAEALISDVITAQLDPPTGQAIATTTDLRIEIGRVLGTLLGVAETLGRLIIDGLNFVLERIFNIEDGLAGLIRELLGELADALERLIDREIDALLGSILGKIQDALDVGGFVGDLLDTFVEEVLGRVGEELDEIVGGLRDVADDIIDSVSDELAELTRDVRDVEREVVAQSERVLRQTEDIVSSNVASGLAPIQGTLDQISATTNLGNISLDGILGVLSERLNTPLLTEPQQFGFQAIFGIDQFLGGVLDGIVGGVGRLLRDALTRFGVDRRAAEQITESLEEALSGNQIVDILLFVLVAGVTLPITFLGATAPFSALVSQTFSRIAEQGLLTDAVIREALNRGLISRQVADDILSRSGFGDADREVLIQLRRQLLGPGELLQLWRRGDIDTNELTRRLGELGWDQSASAELRTLTFFLPPVQDLITMAVREVFTPDVRERFGLDEDFPPTFAERAAQVGVSEQLARDYWASHWALPSAGQGFEMLHRGIIERPDLELLLRSLDVMPFWRERLIQLSFRPLTRVDVRRMFGLGLIGRERVLRNFLDLGYSPEDAELSTQFVEAFNAEEDPAPIEEAAGLTRATVVGFFKDGTIRRSQAMGLLADLGIGTEAADLFLTNAELERERDERTLEVGTILDRVASGSLTFEQGEDRLNRLGLESGELQRALAQLRRRRESRDQLPTVAQLGSMLSKGIIDRATMVETLELRGYSRVWAERLTDLREETEEA